MGNKKNPRKRENKRRTDNTAGRANKVAEAEGTRTVRLTEIKRKIKEGFYETPDFAGRLAEILIEKVEICGASDDDIDDETTGD